jgi:uncharacterized protein
LPKLRFSWDPSKSARNLAERGFDFEFAVGLFTGPTVERVDTRRDYGEVRRLAIGRFAALTLTVVYTDRVGNDGTIERRIISARMSNRDERQAYDQAYPIP